MIVIMSNNLIHRLKLKAEHRINLDAGASLFRREDVVKSVFFVEEGLVELSRHQRDGRLIILQRATDGMIVAEASIYSSSYHCDAVAVLPATIAVFNRENFKQLLHSNHELSELWASYLAKEVQNSRQLIEILTRKTVSEKLDGWFDWRGDHAATKGQWKNVAAQIGVSPEALYRELARRRLK